MKWLGKAILMVAMLAIGASADSAQAQIGPGFGWGGGYGYGMGLYGLMNTEPPPYYALFPPVYYSVPVARPYGYSPFAYPPGTMTPEPASLPVKEVMNPYVPRKSTPKPSVLTASAPREILNPFVQQRRRPVETAQAPAPTLDDRD